ncbi:MAG: hypothetical protein JWN44_3154 [Myxococcales bacterium]|nr:hypothetical protein [Myxococcales bacterium]
MRTPNAATTSPWGNQESLDNGWKDLVVSSAPPPPPREAVEPLKSRELPADFHTWQEHGSRAAAGAVVEPGAGEPSFTAGDRRLWVVAGSLMAMATLVLGLLGALTFGGKPSSSEPVLEAPRAAVVEPVHAVAPSRAVEPSRSAVQSPKGTNPRHLSAKATKHGRHHKRTLSAQR